jgi:hypothetical protein
LGRPRTGFLNRSEVERIVDTTCDLTAEAKKLLYRATLYMCPFQRFAHAHHFHASSGGDD